MSMWNQRYSEPGYAYGTEPNDFLREALPKLPRGRALCLGEGEGRNAVFLAQKGYDVTAVDLAEVGLKKAEALAKERGVGLSTVVADLAQYEVAPAAWDVIVSVWCHMPREDRALLHARCVKGLKPGGAFVLEGYSPRQLELRTGGPPSLALLMKLDDVKAELAGLDFAVARELDRDIHEGKYHQGKSAVVQVLGFKPVE